MFYTCNMSRAAAVEIMLKDTKRGMNYWPAKVDIMLLLVCVLIMSSKKVEKMAQRKTMRVVWVIWCFPVASWLARVTTGLIYCFERLSL